MKNSSKKILITGAGGFIGSHLVDLLVEKKLASKLRLALLPEESTHNINHHKNLEIIRGDIRDSSFIKKAMKDVELVFHLAARIDFDGKTYEEYEDVNVTGTKHLVNAAVAAKVKKFIFYSSIGVHGLPAGIGNIENWDESHPPTYTNFYGQSKWEAEECIREAHALTGLPYAIIRPVSVYGTREKGPTLGLYKAIHSGQFLLIGDGENLMHYVHVSDLVQATYLAAASKRKTGEYIIAGAEATKFKDVVKFVATSINKPLPKISLPKFFAMGISYFFEFFTLLTGVKLPLFPSRVKTMTTTYYFNISKAKKELGYAPKVSFEMGSKQLGKWYMEHNFL
ncbi:MAG: NAD-dependent epimerase/dehydratase family protein [Microgenomates group bacterium]